MKLFMKALMGLIVLAVIAPFYLKDRAGMPMMSLSDLKMPELGTPDIDIPKMPEAAQSLVAGLATDTEQTADVATGEPTPSGKVKMHKWRDENGVWHFTNINTPPKGHKSEVVMIDADSNTYTSSTTDKVKEKVAETVDDIDKVQVSPLLPFTHGKQTMDQAKQVQKMLEQRHKLQQGAM